MSNKPLVGISFLVLSLFPAVESVGLTASPPAQSPVISEIVRDVSIDSFVTNIDRLVGFFTRNTISDTLSDSTGIGAARRWIYDRFSSYSINGDGRLVPGYFDFDDTICEAYGSHRNVTATLPGVVYPEQYIVVGAHFDSRGRDVCDPLEFAPAANDNGSGTAAVLELARVMSTYTFDKSVLFIAFTGEEQGLHGSEAYAAWAESLGVDIRAMINLDTISNAVDALGRVDSTSYRIYSMGPTGSPHRQLARLTKWICGYYVPDLEGRVMNAEDRFGRGGDHQSFRRHGFTAIRFIEANENGAEQHGDQDIPENMDPTYGIKILRSAAANIANLALAPERPDPPAITFHLDGSRRLEWRRSNMESDLAGYLVAVRSLPEAGPFPDETPFKQVIDVGNVNTFPLDRFADAERYAVSIAAYDTLGAVSRFSDETTGPVGEVGVDSLRIAGVTSAP